MGDNTKDSDPAHETMPPELRPFAKPEPPQRLVAPENEARFNAAIGALRILNGSPSADPFYVDPIHDPALAERKAPESVKAYAPPTAVPTPEAKARRAAPAKVVIAEAGAESDQPQETPASPWSKEAPAPERVRGSALPSSHRPREVAATESEAPASTRPSDEQPAGVPPRARRTTAAIAIAILVVGIVIGLRALVTARTPENASRGPVPTATMRAAPPVPTVPAPAPSAEQRAVPASSGATSASAAVPMPPPSLEPAPSIPHPTGKAVQRRADDPYADAAAPPVKTAAPVTTAPSVAPTATAQPAVAPGAPATTSSSHPSGPILGGTE